MLLEWVATYFGIRSYMSGNTNIHPIMKNIARIADIAKVAGVSTATVDRVLHRRNHVSEATRQRVMQAKIAIEQGNQSMISKKPLRFKVFLPEDAGPSTEYLASCFQDVGAKGNVTVECLFTQKMEPAVLARKLRACAGQGVDGVAFQALDDPRVHGAVTWLTGYGIPVIALLSSIDCKDIVSVVAMDNRAAGRTAGLLMGRMARMAGQVAIFSGGQLYHSHEDREMGFRTILRRDFPHIEIVGVYDGNDDKVSNYQETLSLLSQYPELIGIYNVGGGNEGIAQGLKEMGVSDEIILLGHNLTVKTHDYLLDGIMDAVIHQNMRHVAEKSVHILVDHLAGEKTQPECLAIQIITRENMRGVTY